MVVEITEVSRLVELTEHIHDCWFSVAEVYHDPASATLTIPYERAASKPDRSRARGLVLRRFEVPVFRWYLRFFHVNDISIRENERIETYDFNEVTYDERDHLIYIRTNIPLDFMVRVNGLRARVDATEEIVRTKSAFRIWPFGL